MIVVDVFNRENKKLQENKFSKKQYYLTMMINNRTNINNFENYIQESYEKLIKGKKTLFLSWMPNGRAWRNEVLFSIVVAYILAEKQEFVIQHQ